MILNSSLLITALCYTGQAEQITVHWTDNYRKLQCRNPLTSSLNKCYEKAITVRITEGEKKVTFDFSTDFFTKSLNQESNQSYKNF
jgi:hypothetical protein